MNKYFSSKMENLSMCRICLATDVRLCSIASHLRDMYERITAVTFKTEDRRPLVACYICHMRLQNCYRLRMNCLQSEELLTEMMSSGVLKPHDALSTNSFSVVSAVNISIGHVLQESTECHIKEEAPDTYDAEFDLQYTKDMIKEEHVPSIDDNNQFSHLEDSLDGINREAGDVQTDAENIKLKVEDITIEINEPYGAGPSSQSIYNISPKIVKVKERQDVNDTRTGIPVLKKLVHTDSDLVKEPENKNIVFDKLIAASSIRETNDKVGTKFQNHGDNKMKAHNEVYKQTSTSNISSIGQCFTSNVHLERCSGTRAGEKRFQCDVCKKCFRHKQNLIQHMYIHTGEKRFQCDICNKSFRSGTNLTRHMYTHTGEKRFQCDVCNKCMSSKYNLTQHITIHADVKRFRCDVCNKYFKNKQLLTQHMYTHTGQKRLPCDVCKKILSSKQNLIQHMYTHTDDKRFQCERCNKCFGSKQLLNQHMYTHNDEKQFKCDVCNKRFKMKQHLTQHRHIHTDEIRFQCNICEKYFRSNSNLTKHMYTHTGEKRFQCNVCNKYISSKYNLTQHMSTHNNKKRFQQMLQE